MARSHRKTVYRDRLTNRLISESVAKRRDPSTWSAEQWVDPDHDPDLEVDSADDLVSVQATRPGGQAHGESGPARESIHDHQARHAAILELIDRHKRVASTNFRKI